MNINQIYLGDNLELLKQLEDNSIDSVVSDFPYNLSFMGKKWDTHKNFYEWCYLRAIELLRVVKPGAYILIFGSPRTNHHMKMAFEDAGFDIKDEIDWIYSSGMPKSLDISKQFDRNANVERKVIGKYKLPNGQDWNLKQANEDVECVSGTFTSSGKRTLDITAPETENAKKWEGYGTALKPAKEPITMFQKPIENNYCFNIEKYNIGALNIDECRVEVDKVLDKKQNRTINRNVNPNNKVKGWGFNNNYMQENVKVIDLDKGRYPSNFIIDKNIAPLIDEQSGNRPSGKSNNNAAVGESSDNIPLRRGSLTPRFDEGGASRFYKNLLIENDDYLPFYYCPKCSTKEKTESGKINNNHPTVKPKKLIKYLIKLVTPINGISLDICSGSGTHSASVLELVKENYPVNFIGFENDIDFYNLSIERINFYK
jgi:site-specific DNA-methyltransferase (adenine-specific)